MHQTIDGHSVVITGTSTGIGEACALYLDKLGFRVFAGVRKETDGAALKQKASEKLKPVLIDVTDAKTIASTRKIVTDAVGQAGLFGLINNAGISHSGHLEFLPINDVRKQLEVNVIGAIAVTQAFIPLLRMGKGRIINIGSINGLIAFPFMGPYCASKFALEAITDSLRIELAPWGILVSIVEPGYVATPIWSKGLAVGEEMLKTMPKQIYEYYGTVIASLREMARTARGMPADRVAQAVAHALTAKRPKTRYRVGRDSKINAFLRFLPDRIRDRMITRHLPKYG